MNLERLKMLEDLIREEPDDPFNSYALALESMAINPGRSQELFDALLNTHPDYIPTYYQAGNFFWDNGDQTKAIAILKKGLEYAKHSANTRTVNELRALLETLEE